MIVRAYSAGKNTDVGDPATGYSFFSWGLSTRPTNEGQYR